MKRVLAVLLSIFITASAYADTIDIQRSLGSENAPVVLQEFSSMTCPHCANLHKTVYPELIKKYVDTGKVRIVFRGFPLDNLALATNMLALSLPKESFFKFIEHAFFYQKDLHENPKATLLQWSAMAGMTEKQFNNVVGNVQLANAVKADADKAQKRYNITGTPTLVVNGKRLNSVDKASLFKEIEKALK